MHSIITVVCAVTVTVVLRRELRASRTWRHGYAVGRQVGLAQA